MHHDFAVSHDMQACIDACTKCHQHCLQSAWPIASKWEADTSSLRISG